MPELVQISAEIVKTASSRPKLLPEMSRVASTLHSLEQKTLAWSADRVESLVKSLTELQAGLRSQQLEPLNRQAVQALSARCQEIMGASSAASCGTQIKSREVSALLQALGLFGAVQGVAEVQEQLGNWMTDNMQAMALADLMDLAEQSQRSGLADLHKVAELLPRAKGITEGINTENTYVQMLSLLNSCLHAVIAEVPSGLCLFAQYCSCKSRRAADETGFEC